MNYANEELMKIIKHDKDIVLRCDNDGKSPLHFAALNGNLHATKLLVEEGANLNQQDKNGWNALHYATYYCHEDVINFLLSQDGMKVGVKNQDGNTPLHYLSRKKLNKDILKALITKGADINAQNNIGETPLHHSCWGDKQVAVLLVEFGANINLANVAGETPLHWCARMGRVDNALYLVKHGADVNIKGKNGLPLDVAAPIAALKDILSPKPNRDSLGLVQHISDEDSSLLSGKPRKLSDQNDLPPTHSKEVTRSDSLPDLSTMVVPGYAKPNIDENWVIDRSEVQFVEKLGSGTSSKVYKGIYRNQEVAVKVLRDVQTRDINEFIKEFRLMSSVRSPYVAYLYGVILEPTICIVMQSFKRGSLYHVLQEDFPMNWDLFFRFTRDVIMCINCIHTWKPPIVHRDLKTLNLLVDEHGSIKICDFGLSRYTSKSFHSTLGKLRGTYCYSAPELYTGGLYSTASDIYSFGIILWEIATRRVEGIYKKPYSEYKHLVMGVQIIIQVAKKQLRPSISEKIPEPLREMIRQCWDQDADARPDCRHLLQTLDKLQREYNSNKSAWDNLETNIKKERANSGDNVNSTTTTVDNNSNGNAHTQESPRESPVQEQIEEAKKDLFQLPAQIHPKNDELYISSEDLTKIMNNPEFSMSPSPSRNRNKNRTSVKIVFEDRPAWESVVKNMGMK